MLWHPPRSSRPWLKGSIGANRSCASMVRAGSMVSSASRLSVISQGPGPCQLFFGRSGRRAALLESRRSEEHTSELQSLMRISYAVFCLKKKKKIHTQTEHHNIPETNQNN